MWGSSRGQPPSLHNPSNVMDGRVEDPSPKNVCITIFVRGTNHGGDINKVWTPSLTQMKSYYSSSATPILVIMSSFELFEYFTQKLEIFLHR